jgi:hypothetical protein
MKKRAIKKRTVRSKAIKKRTVETALTAFVGDPILGCIRTALNDQTVTTATPLTKWNPDPIWFLWKHCASCRGTMPYWYVDGQTIASVGVFIRYINQWKSNPTTKAAFKQQAT